MTYWGDENGWYYETFPLDVPTDGFGAHGRFLETWRRRCRGDLLPAWRDFDPIADFRDWYGWFNVKDVVSTRPYESRFRLFGTMVCQMYGADYTGKLMSEVPGFFSKTEVQLAQEMIEKRLLARSTGPVRWNRRDWVTVSVLELPLADNGRDVDRIISHIFEPEHRVAVPDAFCHDLYDKGVL